MLTFKNPDDYYLAFLDLYEDAVAQRLRVQGQQRIAATLSGGLDSGSVVALAAPLLAKRGEALPCYVHVPFYAPDAANPRRSGDELALAQQTATHVSNTRLLPLHSEQALLLASMDKFLHTHDAPGHAAGNQYWITDLLETARLAGATVLLTGQGGNATVSYNGDGNLWQELLAGHLGNLFTTLRHEQGGMWQAVKQRLLKPAVKPYWSHWQQYSKHASKPTVWEQYSAINPAFAEELALLKRMQAVGFDPSFSVTSPERKQAFRLGTRQARAYELWMENGAAHGLDVRDPTHDQRIVEFCWRLPDSVFWGQGEQRALIRRGMRQQLPDAVLFNQRKGLQAADIAGRIRAEAEPIQATLEALAQDPVASHCLDLPRMQQLLTTFRNTPQPDPKLIAKLQSILLRGIGVGKFLAG